MSFFDSVYSPEPWYAYIPGILYLIMLLLWKLLQVAAVVLLVVALLKYIREKKEEPKNAAIKKSLGELLKEHRQRRSMTQEFVAEAMGVSRQAVSKWENGTSDPSTTNLLKLAKLYGIPPEELIRGIQVPGE